jgi:small-conductance mechanosensitive channel
LLLLIVGFFVSRFISRRITRLLQKRAGLDAGAVSAIETLGFYLLFIIFAFTSLSLVKFPLTIFTIAGGAVAIGIGFGSQNLMNNFISGLILLVERPIRVGDLIMLGDLVGVVEHIGARSTLVRKTSNVDIIVPNSTFLESNVINWTLSDDTFRTSVSVGVIYGSPLREVSRLIRKAVEEHGRVLKSPDPILLFTEFGADSLNFEIHFWIHMRREMDRRRIESDIRFRIDSLFREAGIVIAFPQRDVHLDTVRPLEVRLVTGDEAETNVP